MTRVTVIWTQPAIEDLARIWQAGPARGPISSAAQEIDSLLRVDPHHKGTDHALAQLDDQMIVRLSARVDALPEDLRLIGMGPLNVFYTVVTPRC